MQAGSGRAGGLTDVVRAQLEQWQDHPNTGRDARVDADCVVVFPSIGIDLPLRVHCSI
jgi:hypothetical protein